MADKMVSALMLAIKSGGIRHLEWEQQCLVAKAIQIIKALPERFDAVQTETRDGGK